MVGDVKQSIYRFRLADPTIFLDKYRRFKPWDQAAEGEERTVVLTRNFRSRPEVLEGTNDLFRNIMSTEFGELDYTQDQALAPGAAFPPEGDWRVELDLEGPVLPGGPGGRGAGGQKSAGGPLGGPPYPGAAGRGADADGGERAAAGGAPSDVLPSPALPLGRCSTTISGPSTRRGCPGPPRAGRTSLPPPRSMWPCPFSRSWTIPARMWR